MPLLASQTWYSVVGTELSTYINNKKGHFRTAVSTSGSSPLKLYSFSLQLVHSQQSSKDTVRQMVMLLSGSFHISYNFLQCFANYLLSSCYDLCLSVLENKVRTRLHSLEAEVINNFPTAIYNESHISLIFFFFFLLLEFLLRLYLKCASQFVFGDLIYIFFIYLYFFLAGWVFVSVRGLSVAAASGGRSSSRCAGLSPLRPLSLRSTGSRRAGSVVGDLI